MSRRVFVLTKPWQHMLLLAQQLLLLLLVLVPPSCPEKHLEATRGVPQMLGGRHLKQQQ
jgi:hypothetical protein